MNYLMISIIVFFSYTCNAQIQEKLNGSWLPERYVLAVLADSIDNLDEYLFPVEGFEISKERTAEFIKNYEIETNNPESLIVIKTYKSEHNTILAEKVLLGGHEKYKLPYFHGSLNMKYIPRETVNRYAKADVYMSKSGNKVLLEIMVDNRSEKIYFVDNVNGRYFKDIESGKKYMQTDPIWRKH